MRRIVVAAVVITACGIGCVSKHVANPSAKPYPVYRVDRPAAPPPTAPQPSDTAPPLTARPNRKAVPSYAMAWFPQGRPISPRWTHIVVHHSATSTGGARRFDSFHRQGNGWDELGYHFVIGNGTDTGDGVVEVGSRWHKQKHGAHCKTPDNYFNDHGIGICLVGDFTRSRPTPRQMESLARLVKFLGGQCGIPAGRITTHHAVKNSTQCPGRFFEMQALRRTIDRVPTASSLP